MLGLHYIKTLRTREGKPALISNIGVCDDTLDMIKVVLFMQSKREFLRRHTEDSLKDTAPVLQGKLWLWFCCAFSSNGNDLQNQEIKF